MFGNSIRICNGVLNLLLRPLEENDLSYALKGLSDWEIKKYLGGVGAGNISTEKEWFENEARDRNNISWAIQPDGVDHAIGNTGLDHIGQYDCFSGFVIWDKSWWRKGVASLCHIARVWFVAKQLNKYLIKSQVYLPNEGSWKALEKVGYIRTGIKPRDGFVDGRFIDTYHYTWINPLAISILYPDGIPEEYVNGIKKADEALKKGDEYIKYI